MPKEFFFPRVFAAHVTLISEVGLNTAVDLVIH